MFDVEWIIRTFGYLGVSGIIFAESGLFFGFFLPGDSLLFTAGYLASQGLLSISLLSICAISSAIIGDSVGYWFGRKTGPYIFSRPNSIFFSQQRVKEAKDFFEKYGGKSIILARFIPAVRTFTPIMAGVAQMRYRVFLMFNVIGGVLWAGGLTCAGYALVRVFPNAEQYITAIIILIILVSAIPLYKPAFRLLQAYMKKRKNTHTHTHAE